jgi:hypothetical protein
VGRSSINHEEGGHEEDRVMEDGVMVDSGKKEGGMMGHVGEK